MRLADTVSNLERIFQERSSMRNRFQVRLPIFIFFCVVTVCASAQSFRVQCPTSTITHPSNLTNVNAEPEYTGPTTLTTSKNGGYLVPKANVNGAIKCQQISGGDGFSTMADGTQTYMFSFGPLSGLADIAAGKAGTEFPAVFNMPGQVMAPGDPATTDLGATPSIPVTTTQLNKFSYNGAVGLALNVTNLVTIYDIAESGNTVYVQTNSPLGLNNGDSVVISGTGVGYDGTWTVTAANVTTFPGGVTNYGFPAPDNFTFTAAATGLADVNESPTATAATPSAYDGHVDPRPIMDVGVMNGNIPAPLMAIDEDDEFFLTLTNVGMIMRPDLFEQHTVHFHGYPNASAYYDGVPDASVAINIGGSFTYYYLAPDAGTYFWHCHITPPEHLQMGMVGQLYVRPRQDRVAPGGNLYSALGWQNGPTATGGAGTVAEPSGHTTMDLRTACNPSVDILCSATMPAIYTGATRGTAGKLCNGTSPSGEGTTPEYVYNDGDGSSCYDVTYPIQMHGFDPNFHFVGMTFNPELFVDMKDKYFLLNGRGYPDTVAPGPQATITTDGQMHYSQPLPAIINIPAGGKASLRFANLSVAEYFTLQSSGVPMHVVGWMAKLLRDQDGNNTEYWANSIK